MIRHARCPRCRCCDVETQHDNSMLCIGHCNRDGSHDPETAEEWKDLLAEKDALIRRLQRELTAERSVAARPLLAAIDGAPAERGQ